MASLIDSSLWIDFTRARSPRALKEFIAPHILSPDAVLSEPVAFEVLRHAADEEIRAVQAQFDTMPMVQTPKDLWSVATKLGQSCRRKGINAGSIDLLIAAVALHHSAELVTFDGDFQRIGKLCGFQVNLLQRPPIK